MPSSCSCCFLRIPCSYVVCIVHWLVIGGNTAAAARARACVPQACATCHATALLLLVALSVSVAIIARVKGAPCACPGGARPPARPTPIWAPGRAGDQWSGPVVHQAALSTQPDIHRGENAEFVGAGQFPSPPANAPQVEGPCGRRRWRTGKVRCRPPHAAWPPFHAAPARPPRPPPRAPGSLPALQQHLPMGGGGGGGAQQPSRGRACARAGSGGGRSASGCAAAHAPSWSCWPACLTWVRGVAGAGQACMSFSHPHARPCARA